MTTGLRRFIRIPDNGDEYLIIQKLGNSLPKKIGINPSDVQEYVIVKKSGDSYEMIDYEGESDGFDSYQGAEQFLRAYIKNNYDELPHRWYINEFPRSKDGKLVDKHGDEHDF